MTTSQKDTVVSVDSVEKTDESPKTNFAAKAVSSVTKFVTDHPLLVWGGVAVVAGAVAVALAPKEEILKSRGRLCRHLHYYGRERKPRHDHRRGRS